MKKNRLILLFVCLLALCAALFAFFYQEAKREAIYNLNIQQSLHARQAAQGIEDFFSHWTGVLTVMAKLSHVIHLNKPGREVINNAYQAGQGPIRGITRVDAAGRIVYTVPFNRSLIGRDISSQSPIREIMRTHKSAISDVFTFVQGYQTAAFHVPIFRNGIYGGTIGIAIDFQFLARRYLEPIKIGTTGYAWVIGRDGTELYCPVPGHTGKSVYTNCKDFPSILTMAGEMIKGHQGATTYVFDQIAGKTVKSVKKHAFYMPIPLGNTFWSIVVASSEEEVLASLADFRNRLLLLFVLFLLSAALFAYYGLKAWFIIQKQEKRLQAETALKESETRFRSLIENAPEALYVHADGKFIYMNQRAANLFGAKDPDQLIGSSVMERIHSSFQEVVRKRLQILYEERRNLPGLEQIYVRLDGSEVPVEISVVPIQYDGRTAALTFAHDITERRQAQDKLRESTALLSAIFDHIEPGIILIDSATHRIVNANRAAVAMCGATWKDMVGKVCHQYICPAAQGKCPITNLHQKIDKAEQVLLTTDGQEIPVLKTAVPVRISERDYLLESFIDMREHKRLESQLLQAQKMEAIGTLAGGIAHDFNNLLMGIQGVASLLLLDLDPSRPQYERLKMIEDQVKRGADLTKQLLGFARGGRYQVKPTNINKILGQSSALFGRTKKEIVIHEKYEEGIWAVEVDQGQMEQAFLNLYVNAWQAMPGGGSLFIETKNIVLGPQDHLPEMNMPGRYVKISICDTGTGMDQKTKERIFDPFFTTKAIGRGTGLGLAMVYGIIMGHKGMINVYSEPGHGTTFNIYLPASEKTVAEKRADSRAMLTGTETILLVDDEKMVLEVSRDMLESLGYQVYAAGSGQEAIAIYMEKRNQIDLVILDMIMAGISGGETFDRLHQIDPEVRVLLSSGYSVNGRAQQILDRGCLGFLQKPFNMEGLSRKIREILDT